MPPQATVFRLIPEKSSAKLTGIIRDESGVAVPGASLTTWVLTIYDLETQAIINTVDHVNILNVGRGTVDGSGNFSVQFEPNDNPIITVSKTIERHVWLFEWTYQGGTRIGRQEMLVNVQNLSKVA